MLTTHKVQLRVVGGIVVGNTGMAGIEIMLSACVHAGTAGILLRNVPVPAHRHSYTHKCDSCTCGPSSNIPGEYSSEIFE